jgi:hypothetical protein
VNGVSGDKKSKQICLDISPVFFHIVPKPVQTLAIMYDEIFQVLAIGGEILLLKPFLDLSFEGVIIWKWQTVLGRLKKKTLLRLAISI